MVNKRMVAMFVAVSLVSVLFVGAVLSNMTFLSTAERLERIEDQQRHELTVAAMLQTKLGQFITENKLSATDLALYTYFLARAQQCDKLGVCARLDEWSADSVQPYVTIVNLPDRGTYHVVTYTAQKGEFEILQPRFVIYYASLTGETAKVLDDGTVQIHWSGGYESGWAEISSQASAGHLTRIRKNLAEGILSL